jgi:hypothetical protein
VVALLNELLHLVVEICGGGDDGGEAKGVDKMNIAIEGGDKVNLAVVNKYF